MHPIGQATHWWADDGPPGERLRFLDLVVWSSVTPCAVWARFCPLKKQYGGGFMVKQWPQ